MTHPFVNYPKIQRWSARVTSVLGLNPNIFTGPGTNTFLLGTGRRRVLLDTGQGKEGYIDLLEQALEKTDCELECIVATHSHPDHVGGIRELRERFGSLPILCWRESSSDPRVDAAAGLEEAIHLGEGELVETEGATLRALHTPGHAADHLCFYLEEEQAIFTGDNVLGEGIGTPVILMQHGDLGDYLHSLGRLLEENPAYLYPGHGARIDAAAQTVQEILAHRQMRDTQILRCLEQGPARIAEMVERIYVEVPKLLHPAAAQSVGSHLLKLERENVVARVEPAADPLETAWRLR